ncbi:MAG: AAA family ATPase [Chitinophagaceae bacterium]|nr:AAA family ATPase [Chitinophagaceae bacterium]
MSNRITPWYEVYRVLASSMYLFYQRGTSDPATRFFADCSNNEIFLKENEWVKSKWSNDALDPIQILGSINSLTLGDELRRRRIDALFGVLGLDDEKYGKIDFSGCPTPVAVRLLSFRTKEIQNEIWSAFSAIMEKGQDGLDGALFDRVRAWPGVGIPSFTMFLFWVQPRNFLPLDKNTLKVIIQKNKELDPVHDYDDYKHLLVKEDTDDYLEMARFARLTPEAQRKDTRRQEIVTEIAGGHAAGFSDGGLRILAIRVLDGCSRDLIGPLKPGTLYPFCAAYTIQDGQDEIEYHPEKDHDLYHTENLDIDINAIVGKNGTGKSSLTHLLLAIVNNIACSYRDAGVLNDGDFELQPHEDLHAVIYLKAEKIYRIRVTGGDIIAEAYQLNGLIYKAQTPELISKVPLSSLYYTLLVNYSFHGLNETNVGTWLRPLFHKNDSYQIPATIDPFRDNGTIRAGTLDNLTKDRLLANILEPVLDLQADNPRKLTEYQLAVGIQLKLNEEKVSGISVGGKEYPINHFAGYEQSLERFLADYGLKFDIADHIGNTTVIGRILVYIYRKLISVAETYVLYQVYLGDDGLLNEEAYFLRLADDRSHVTVKLRRAINFLKHDHFPKEEVIYKQVEDLSKEISNIQLGDSSLKTIELIPPSCFDVEIQMAEIDMPTRISSFNKLSSGEKQLIFTINAITYHLRNLDSVHRGQASLIRYNYINVTLDEVELYFHPELQRQFLSRLRRQIEILDLEHIKGINLVFITHSPFILSDIPKGNTLFLYRPGGAETVPIEEKDKKNTFGANIHELLASGFFMEDTKGSFAIKKMAEIMEFCNNVLDSDETSRDNLKTEYDLKKQQFYFIRDNIGENYLQAILDENILDIEKILGTREYIHRRVRQLEQEISKLSGNA